MSEQDINRMALRLAEIYPNKFQEFIHGLEKASEISLREKGKLFSHIGIVLYESSYFSLAAYSWERALKYFLKTHDEERELSCYINLGHAYSQIADFEKAIEFHKKGLKMALQSYAKYSELICYGSLGSAYRNLGDFEKAIEFHKKALNIVLEGGNIEALKHGGNIEALSRCYLNLGNVYANLGYFENAIEFYDKALENKIKDKNLKARCYLALGESHAKLGSVKNAIEFHKKGLKMALQSGDRVTRLHCYIALGKAYYELEAYRKSIRFYEKALEIMDKVEGAQKSHCYAALGTAYSELGDLGNAIEFHKKGLKMALQSGDIDSERKIYLGLGIIYGYGVTVKGIRLINDYDNRWKNAYDCFKRSIQLTEVIGGKLLEEEHKWQFYGQSTDAYQYMVPLCVQLNKQEEAFEYVERSKSRALLDLLASGEIRPSSKITTELDSLLNQEKIYLSRLQEIRTRHLRNTNLIVEPGEVDQMLEGLKGIYDKIEEIDPEYVLMRSGRPAHFKEIVKMLQSN